MILWEWVSKGTARSHSARKPTEDCGILESFFSWILVPQTRETGTGMGWYRLVWIRCPRRGIVTDMETSTYKAWDVQVSRIIQ
jgi:hypothetical protein